MHFSTTILFFLSSFLSEHSVLVEASSSKSSKSTKKSSKSSKSKTSPTKPLSQAEKYFGVLPDKVAASYIRIEDARGYVTGTPTIFGSTAVLDSYVDYGDYSDEEVVTICMIKCEENPLCTSFEIKINPGVKGRNRHQCEFFNPSLGTVLTTDVIVKQREGDDSIFFYKEETLPPLAFEKFACDVDPDAEAMDQLIFCILTTGTDDFDAVRCPDLLTDDALRYVAPAVSCVINDAVLNEQDPLIAVITCLECTSPAVELYDGNYLSGCQVNSFICENDASVPSLFGATNGVCGDSCTSTCVEELSTALLCALGALPLETNVDRSGGCVSSGIPGLDPFTCPSADFVAPTPEDYAAFLVENSD